MSDNVTSQNNPNPPLWAKGLIWLLFAVMVCGGPISSCIEDNPATQYTDPSPVVYQIPESSVNVPMVADTEPVLNTDLVSACLNGLCHDGWPPTIFTTPFSSSGTWNGGSLTDLLQSHPERFGVTNLLYELQPLTTTATTRPSCPCDITDSTNCYSCLTPDKPQPDGASYDEYGVCVGPACMSKGNQPPVNSDQNYTGPRFPSGGCRWNPDPNCSP